MALGMDLSPLKHLGDLVENLPKDLEPLKELPGQMEDMVMLLREINSNIARLANTHAAHEHIASVGT